MALTGVQHALFPSPHTSVIDRQDRKTQQVNGTHSSCKAVMPFPPCCPPTPKTNQNVRGTRSHCRILGRDELCQTPGVVSVSSFPIPYDMVSQDGLWTRCRRGRRSPNLLSHTPAPHRQTTMRSQGDGKETNSSMCGPLSLSMTAATPDPKQALVPRHRPRTLPLKMTEKHCWRSHRLSTCNVLHPFFQARPPTHEPLPPSGVF